MEMMIKLGARLQKVASFIPNGACLGDIGTDHAYLPIRLAEQGIISKAVAVDVHHGPYQSALKAVRERGLSEVIDVRFGDGLQPIQPGEVDTLTLTGMGGGTILEILSARPEIMQDVSCLILQPQGAEGKLRHELCRSGWRLNAECLVEEEGRIYNIFFCRKDQGMGYQEIQQKIGQWQKDLVINLQLPDEEAWQRSEQIIGQIVWQYGALLLEKPDELLLRLIEERIRSLGFQIRGMSLARNPLIYERKMRVQLEADLLQTLVGILKETMSKRFT